MESKHAIANRMSEITTPFALRIIQRKTGIAASVYRRKVDGNGDDRLQQIATISPLAVTAATPLLREAVFGSQNDDTSPQPLCIACYPLDADAGARVACFSLIAIGLRDAERLTRAANHLRYADANEAAWWLGLLTRDNSSRTLRALRILTEAVQ